MQIAPLYYALKRLGLGTDPGAQRPQDQQIVLLNREAVIGGNHSVMTLTPASLRNTASSVKPATKPMSTANGTKRPACLPRAFAICVTVLPL